MGEWEGRAASGGGDQMPGFLGAAAGQMERAMDREVERGWSKEGEETRGGSCLWLVSVESHCKPTYSMPQRRTATASGARIRCSWACSTSRGPSCRPMGRCPGCSVGCPTGRGAAGAAGAAPARLRLLPTHHPPPSPSTRSPACRRMPQQHICSFSSPNSSASYSPPPAYVV